MSQNVCNTNNQTPGKGMATIIYALQAASFFLGFTFLIAVILAYLKKGSAQNTWLESHFRWQINTFWISLVLSILSFVTVFFFGLGYLVLLVAVVWVIYRIAKGWLRLIDGRPM